jgi:hypothetical protein
MDILTIVLLALAAIVLVGVVRSIPRIFSGIRETIEKFRDVGKPPEGPVDEPFDPDRRV